MAAAESALDTDAAEADPRVRRTRAQLTNALVRLAAERDLADITIAELTRDAGVNRATFYLHYATKEAVLLGAIDDVTAQLSAGAAAATGDELDDTDHAPRHTEAFFAELENRAPLYRRILGPTGSPAVVARLADGLQRVVMDEIRRRAPDDWDDDRAIERRAAFVAGGVLAAAVSWLNADRRPPAAEEAVEVWRLVLASTAPRST